MYTLINKIEDYVTLIIYYGIYSHHSDTGLCCNFIFVSPAKYEIVMFCLLSKSRNKSRTQAGGQNAEKGNSSENYIS